MDNILADEEDNVLKSLLSSDERKELVNKMDSLIEKGDIKEFNLIGGPCDGIALFIYCKNGEPKMEIITACVDKVYRVNVWHKVGEYKWNPKKGNFEYTGKMMNRRGKGEKLEYKEL